MKLITDSQAPPGGDN